MKIVQLHAENFKRLGVVEITPDGNVVTIGGKNGHGKSSVLDAIYVALKGRAVAPPKPVRAGEEKCTIRLDMGDVVVTRTFTQKEGDRYTDTVKVENGEGLRYGTPQDVLNALLGEIGFDPFEFVKLKPAAQASRLLEMVPLSIDLDEFKQLDASDYANRTDANRDVARLQTQVDAIPVEEVPETIPDREAITDELGNAANTNTAIEQERTRRENARERIAQGRDKVKGMKEEAEALRARANEIDTEADDITTRIDGAEEALAALPELDPLVDTDDLRQQLRDAEAVLATVERQNRRAALVKELEAAKAKSQGYTDAMAERAKERNAALADADMPVEGLSFALNEKGEPVLMFEGLPFDKDQISTAAQLRVSTAIGMAANPRLRVLRIMDGSLLDEDSMAMLATMAEAEDYQLWVEVVSKDESVGIIMENGLIVGGTMAPAVEPEPQADPGPAAEDKPKKFRKGQGTPGNDGDNVNAEGKLL